MPDATLIRATRWVENGEMMESDKRVGMTYHAGPHDDWMYKWGDNPNWRTSFPDRANDA